MTRRPDHLRSVPPLGSSRGDARVFAVVPSIVALWLLETVGRQAMEAEIRRLEARGKPGLATHMRFGLEQLRMAAEAEEQRRLKDAGSGPKEGA